MRTATTTKAFRRFRRKAFVAEAAFAGAALRGLAFGSSAFGASDFVSAAGSGVPGVTASKFQYQVRTAFARSTGFLDSRTAAAKAEASCAATELYQSCAMASPRAASSPRRSRATLSCSCRTLTTFFDVSDTVVRSESNRTSDSLPTLLDSS
jgi:hypothetical protein